MQEKKLELSDQCSEQEKGMKFNAQNEGQTLLWSAESLSTIIGEKVKLLVQIQDIHKIEIICKFKGWFL